MEIKNIDLNQTMIHAIAKQVEAERLRPAKVITAEGDVPGRRRAPARRRQDHGDRARRHAAALSRNPAEISRDRSNTIVFPFPTELRQILDSATARAGSPSGA